MAPKIPKDFKPFNVDDHPEIKQRIQDEMKREDEFFTSRYREDSSSPDWYMVEELKLDDEQRRKRDLQFEKLKKTETKFPIWTVTLAITSYAVIMGILWNVFI